MIYFDNAATTKPHEEVLQAMYEAYINLYGNPSSIHALGSKAKASLEDARSGIASLLGAGQDELYFTSGASESINWVLKGSPYPIITSQVEHKAGLESCRYLQSKGRELMYLGVDENGLIDLDELDDLTKAGGFLLSFIYANNETGVLQDIRSISEIAKKNKCLLHVDGVQALGKVPINFEDIDVDYMSFSSHKIHGPKGIGLLYMKKEARLSSLIHGGSQENGMRAGTEDLPGIMGFAKAIQLATESMDKNKDIEKLRTYIETRLVEEIPDLKINASQGPRVANISSVSLPGQDGARLLMMLDMRGICLSAGSACTAGALEKSHVLKAMGLDQAYIGGTLRISLSADNTYDEADIFIKALKDIVNK